MKLIKSEFLIGKLLGDSFWSILSRVVPAFAMISNTGLLVRYLGPDAFGLIATLWATVMWGNFLNLGLSGALINSLTLFHSNNDDVGYRRELGSGLRALWGVIGLGLVLALVIAIVVNWGPVFVGSEKALWPLANRLVVVALLAFAFSFAAGALYPDYAGRIQLGLYYKISTVSPLLGALAVWWAVAMRISPLGCAVALWLVPNVFSLVALVFIAGCRRLAEAWSDVGWVDVLPMLRKSRGFFFVQVSAVVMSATDVFLVSRCDSLANVTAYVSTNRLFLFSLTIIGGLIAPIYPRYRIAVGRGDYQWVKKTLRWLMGGAWLYFIGSILGAYWLIPFIAKVWLGGDVRIDKILCLLLACVVGFRLMADIQGQVVLALERMRFLVFISFSQIAVYLGVFISLGASMHARAVVIGLIAAYIFTNVVFAFQLKGALSHNKW